LKLTTSHIANLVRRYAGAGPRYTSYPTANHFSDAYKPGNQVETLSSMPAQQALSLYIHVPFCQTICYYCACNKIVTADKKKAATYLDYLEKEFGLVSRLLAEEQPVEQLHFGGGTPTYLNDEQLSRVISDLRHSFNLSDKPDRDYSIEIDPRTVDGNRIRHLTSLGFNRLSLGIQDFDTDVQKAINRLQSTQETKEIVDTARDAGFKSISVDLMYGLPLQTVSRFEKTLEEVRQINPDRISLFNYAHLPARFKTQRQIKDEELPSPGEKLKLLSHSIRYLVDAGYQYVGLDHFAKPDDDLFTAQSEGSLHRNFQGYTTHSHCDLIGFGVSSISSINGHYSQNFKTLDAYYQALDKNTLPVEKGLSITPDDEITRDVLTNLMCKSSVNFRVFEERFNTKFEEYYESEMQTLQAYSEDGLLELSATGIQITDTGRLLLRNIAAVFDAYLPVQGTPNNFSQSI